MLTEALSMFVPAPLRRRAARARATRRVRRADWERRPPLLVYQMGKVGSTTVYGALAAAGLPYSVYHVHWLSHDGLRESRAYLETVRGGVPASLHESAAIRRRLDEEPPAPLRVVTLVRDPIRRQISDFFQGLGRWSPDCRDAEGRTSGPIALEQLRERLAGLHDAPRGPCTWFDAEFRPALGVDVFDHPFDADAGHSVIVADGVEVLILRLEDLGRCFESAVSRFLGVDRPPVLARANVTSEKSHGDAYRYVREHLDLPAELLHDVYTSRYARHFHYDGSEAGVSGRW